MIERTISKVNMKITNQRKKVIGHITDTLAKVNHVVMTMWKVHQVIAKNNGKHRRTPEKTRVSVSEIEIPCIYFSCGKRLIRVVY